MRAIIFLFFFITTSSILFSQYPKKRILNITPKEVNRVDSRYLELNNENSKIREDYLLNERLVDLVDVYEVDSILPLKTQRHRIGPVGWFIRIAGYCWRSINMKRVKFVGTVKGDIHGTSKEHFTEYDVNWNVIPHFKQYQDYLNTAYKFQVKRNKFIRKKPKDGPPFYYDRNDNSGKYDMHCELTPGRQYRHELNEKFYPCVKGGGLSSHHNFGEKDPTLGLYGPLVADCNHSCHPEIHPYEWLWWLEVNPAKDHLNSKRWVVGFFREMSNRFRGWSKRPRVGVISIPFLFPVDAKNPTIHIEHLTFSEHVPEGLKRINEMPEDAVDMNFSELELSLNGLDKSIIITTNHPLRFPGMNMWFKDLQTDGKWIAGKVTFGCSVVDMHTFKVILTE